MGLFSSKAASAIDTTARAAHDAATKVGGETGGKVADAVSNAVLAPVRNRINEPCTCSRNDCGH